MWQPKSTWPRICLLKASRVPAAAAPSAGAGGRGRGLEGDGESDETRIIHSEHLYNTIHNTIFISLSISLSPLPTATA